MEMDLQNIKQMDDKTKSLVFGFVRHIDVNKNQNIPDLIVYVILAFYYNIEYFDDTHHQLTHKQSTITATSSSSFSNAIGNITIPAMGKQTHCWTFNIIKKGYYDIYIGIAEDGRVNKKDDFCRNGYGYGIDSDGDMFSANSNDSNNYMGNSQQEFDSNDAVLMVFNPSTQQLSFKLNNNKNKDIVINKIKINENIKYKMVVRLWCENDSVKLLNYFTEKQENMRMNEKKEEISDIKYEEKVKIFENENNKLKQEIENKKEEEYKNDNNNNNNNNENDEGACRYCVYC